MIIKAGTYRFNDVLSNPEFFGDTAGTFSFDISFTSKYYADLSEYGYGVINAVLKCSRIDLHCINLDSDGTRKGIDVHYFVESSAPDLSDLGTTYPIDSWVYNGEDGGNKWAKFSAECQTITIPKDIDASDEFGTWFYANVKEQKQISGKWRWNDVLSAPSADLEQAVDFSVNCTLGGVDYIVDCSRMKCYSNDTSNGVGGVYLQYYFDANATYTGAYANDGEYTGWKTDTFGEGVKTTDYGTTPQWVSADYYDYVIANAKPVVASIHYNGSTIASLFGGQTATLKLKGDGVQIVPDIVFEVAENVGGGSGGATVVPLTVTENGTYDNPLKQIIETWDNTMEYDIPFADGAAFRKAENLFVPNSLVEINSGNYILSVTENGEISTAVVGVDILAMDIVGDGSTFVIGDAFVVFVKSASSLNASMGASVFEDNTVYVSNTLGLSAESEWSISLSAPGNEKADGYLPVTVSLPVTDELAVTPGQLNQTFNDGTYYKQVTVKGVPVRSLTITPSTEKQTFSFAKDDNGSWLEHEDYQWFSNVTVEAVDFTKMEVLCDIELEALPKTEYKVGEWLNTDGGVILLHYTNGATYRIPLENSDVLYFVIDSVAQTYVTQQPGVYKLGVEVTKNGITCRTTYDITVTE